MIEGNVGIYIQKDKIDWNIEQGFNFFSVRFLCAKTTNYLKHSKIAKFKGEIQIEKHS